MRKILFPVLVAALLFVIALQASAGPAPGTVLFSDGFESYSAGVLNGQGPWVRDYAIVGKTSTNGYVYSTPYANASWHENIPQLPGSTRYLAERNNYVWDYDGDAVDLAYHAGGGANLQGDFKLDWMFYDPAGASFDGTHNYTNPANFTSALYLSAFGGVPASHELTGADTLSWDMNNLQRIGVGAADDYTGAYDRTKYQVQVVGATGGYDGSWFNTSVTRSVGWHEGTITVGAPLAGGMNLIQIAIDGTQVYQGNATAASGYDLLELKNTLMSGAFDNITITAIPEPSSILALGMGLVGVLGLIKRRK